MADLVAQGHGASDALLRGHDMMVRELLLQLVLLVLPQMLVLTAVSCQFFCGYLPCGCCLFWAPALILIVSNLSLLTGGQVLT